MGDNLGPQVVVQGLQGLLLKIDIVEIIVDEADEPNAFVDFLDAERLACKDGGEVDLFAMRQIVRSW
jgi:hypothetical protein